jgi:hypothetical protein
MSCRGTEVDARYPAVAVAVGMEATAGAARDAGVPLLLEGGIDGWQEALHRMLAAGGSGAQEPLSDDSTRVRTQHRDQTNPLSRA